MSLSVCPPGLLQHLLTNGSIILTTMPWMTSRSKHNAIKYHFFKEHVPHGEIQILKVTSQEQIADCMMKGLEKALFECVRHLLAGW